VQSVALKVIRDGIQHQRDFWPSWDESIATAQHVTWDSVEQTPTTHGVTYTEVT